MNSFFLSVYSKTKTDWVTSQLGTGTPSSVERQVLAWWFVVECGWQTIGTLEYKIPATLEIPE